MIQIESKGCDLSFKCTSPFSSRTQHIAEGEKKDKASSCVISKTTPGKTQSNKGKSTVSSTTFFWHFPSLRNRMSFNETSKIKLPPEHTTH